MGNYSRLPGFGTLLPPCVPLPNPELPGPSFFCEGFLVLAAEVVRGLNKPGPVTDANGLCPGEDPVPLPDPNVVPPNMLCPVADPNPPDRDVALLLAVVLIAVPNRPDREVELWSVVVFV